MDSIAFRSPPPVLLALLAFIVRSLSQEYLVLIFYCDFALFSCSLDLISFHSNYCSVKRSFYFTSFNFSYCVIFSTFYYSDPPPPFPTPSCLDFILFHDSSYSLCTSFRRNPLWGTTDAVIKAPSVENPELTNVLPLKLGIAQNIATHASPTARNVFLVLISTFSVRSP